MINFGRVEADIFVGSAPVNRVDIVRLSQLKVTTVVSLQHDEDFVSHRIYWPDLQRAYDEHQIDVQRFPIFDFDEGDLGDKLPAAVHALRERLTEGHRVYVHCNAGVCRAPATVLAYLCHYRGMTISQGLEYIRRQRPQANPYQESVLTALSHLSEQA